MLPAVLVVAVVAVAAALVAADRVARAVVLRRVASRVGAASGAAQPPQVRIAGPVFLTQLLAGRYREVQVTIAAFSAGGVDFSGLTARLAQVRAPLGLLLSDGLVAGQVAATATIPLGVLGSRLPPGLALRHEGGEIVVFSSLVPMPVSGVLRVSADAQRIALTPRVLGVPSLVGFAIGLPALPPELVIESVSVSDIGLAVRLRGADVALAMQLPAAPRQPSPA